MSRRMFQPSFLERLGPPSGPSIIFTPKEMAHELPQLRGRRVLIDYQRGVDGPQTAARVLKDTFQSAGIDLRKSKDDAECLIWIQAGKQHMRFAFVVGDPRDESTFVYNECGPRELAAAVMTAVCRHLNPRKDALYPDEDTEISKLISCLDTEKNDQLAAVEGQLLQLGERAIDSILRSVADLNRSLTRSVLAQDHGQADNLMRSLGRRIRILDNLRNPRGINAILDALADSTTFAGRTGVGEAIVLSEIAEDALVNLGEAAIPHVQKHLHSVSLPVRSKLTGILTRIESGDRK